MKKSVVKCSRNFRCKLYALFHTLSLPLCIFLRCTLLIKQNAFNYSNQIQTDIIKLLLICPIKCDSNLNRNSNLELFSA